MPTPITNLLIAASGSSDQTGEIRLGTPTCSARGRHLHAVGAPLRPAQAAAD
jgi:hypothetical protein